MHLKRFLITIGLALVLSSATVAFAVFAGSQGSEKLSEHTIVDVVAETLEKRRAKLDDDPNANIGDTDEINILVLGLDARKEDAHPHCDAIHMFSLNLKDETILITSVPRGTYAYIPTENLNWEKFNPNHFPPPPPPPPLPTLAPEDTINAVLGTTDSETLVAPPAQQTQPVNDEEPAQIIPWNPKIAFISNQSYIANACALVNLDYGIDQIEKVVGKNADYLLTVGFSQTLGILRTLDMPTTETLQFLRHRQGYAIGDPQRSHNQGLFLKDLFVSHANKFSDPITTPLQRVLYSFIQTDMSFATAHTLLNLYLDSGITSEPDRITLTMKPAHTTVDYHFDPENPDEHLANFKQNIAPRLSEKDFSSLTTEDMQAFLLNYIEGRLILDEPVADLINKQIWLQVEDDDARESAHFDLLSKHIETITNNDIVVDLLTDYIIEKETLGIQEFAEKGKDLLSQILEPEESEVI